MDLSYRNSVFVTWTVIGILSAYLFVEAFALSMFVSTSRMPWSSSIQYCRENNGSLIVLNSLDKWNRFSTENDVNYDGRISINDSWIGMNTTSHHCRNYTWLGGIPNTWTNWDVGQPNYCEKRQCVKLKYLKMRTARCFNSWIALCENDTTEIPSSTESVTPTNEPSTADKQTTITTHRMSDLFSDATTSPVDDATDTTVSNEEVTSNDKDFTTNNHITTTEFFSTESASLTGPSSTDSGATSTPYDLTHKYDTTSTNFSVDDNLRTTEVNDATTSISSDYITYNNTQTDTMQCCCRKAKEIQFKQEELQNAIAAMKKKLTVLKSNTSMSRRKLISVYDARPSSVIIGSSGCVIIIFILCLIVIPDILHLVYAVTNKKGQRSNNRIQV